MPPDSDLLGPPSEIQQDDPRALAQENAALRARVAELRGIFDNAIEGLFQASAAGLLRTANPALARMLGYEGPKELLREAPDLFQRLFQDPALCSQVVASLEQRGMVLGLEIQARRRDGRPVWLSCNARALRGPHGELTGLEGSVADVSERKRLEEQLLQSRKLEGIGRLAGGIAHDFNNLLTGIMSYADLVHGSLPEDDPRRADTAEILRAGRRAAELTGQLLTFARRQIIRPRVIDLAELVRGTEKLLRRVIGEDVELCTALPAAPAPVRVDPGQFEQILVNLAVNARDAMPRGGHLAIEVSDGLKEVELRVRDTGVGMDEQVRGRLFEPFFSTKEAGRGNGLGLATCYGVVQQSGGDIEVRSAPGEGAEFTIRLPRADEAELQDLRDEAPTTVAGGQETILFVEDEPMLRQLGERSLRPRGYQVITAASGREALEAARAFAGPIHLLATDLVMPDVDGRQLAEQLRAERPHLRVLYLSGHTEDAMLRYGLEQARTPLLPKPFTPTLLAQKVREALDAPRGRSAPQERPW